jgi:hypothetical protein
MTASTPVLLDRFILDGTFGSIALGMDEDAVRALLGPPEGYSTGRGPFRIWKYGSLELTFEAHRLTMIYFEFPRGLVLPPTLAPEGYFPSAISTPVEFREYLRERGIPCQVYDNLTFDGQVALYVGVGVVVGFVGETRTIHSMGYMLDGPKNLRLRPCPPDL